MIRLALAALLLSASAAAAFPVTVKSCDRDVTFDAAPTRAISNDVNLTEMMLVLGLRDHMVGYTGISGWKTLDPEMREGVAELPELSAKYPSKEVLAAAEADFFFAGWNYGMKVGGEVTPETLEPFGIKTYELTESCIHIGPKARSTMQDMYQDMLNLGRIFGVEDRAEALVAGYKARLAEATKGVDHDHPLRVFVYDSGEEAPFTAGKYAMPTALIEAAGGVNIMDDLDKSWAEVAWEPVVARNPQVVVIVNYGDVTAEQKIAFMKGNPAFADIDAVKNDRFVVLEYVEATPGPRNIRAVEKLVAGFAGQ
ncbi:iron complex transport system substrate-binding protein [Gemmobacter caeni]|uniref:Iron complex transport system substrate-binding protein n=2 Tax=Gemmobacter TaxID=204456 RepID=A0A2T6AVP6_9RHOB|nr:MULTISPECIES: ABC transporter substrate-binding protein [Gemmobacter]PTX47877.1 iron complex transport system substrate-binding protein [Gemmobacter caeni]TWI97401.1 iron complex transport system substrate-binding protein [Gemmobacter caeni]GHC31063.1 iron ABC transporter substrate-binding protein [Gemmobacter nanjingensis]